MKTPPFRTAIYLDTQSGIPRAKVNGLDLTRDYSDRAFTVLLRVRHHSVPRETYTRRARLWVSRRHRWQGSPNIERVRAYYNGQNCSKFYWY